MSELTPEAVREALAPITGIVVRAETVKLANCIVAGEGASAPLLLADAALGVPPAYEPCTFGRSRLAAVGAAGFAPAALLVAPCCLPA